MAGQLVWCYAAHAGRGAHTDIVYLLMHLSEVALKTRNCSYLTSTTYCLPFSTTHLSA
jgi:hypothetical protein